MIKTIRRIENLYKQDRWWELDSVEEDWMDWFNPRPATNLIRDDVWRVLEDLSEL